MSKLRWIISGAVIGFLVALTLGFVHDDGSTFGGMMGSGDMAGMMGSGDTAGMMGSGDMAGMMGSGDMQAAMEQMHDSEQMQAMHEAMPEELRAACEALHEQMSGAAGMPATGDMPMDPGDHAAHHPTGS